jgi:nitroimidazol reductase NimA-like FMN-containing flavoprotein (pyridoxamine 5'-phosphate oxidase superfamily)
MTADRIEEFLRTGYCGRLGTIGSDGWPYVCPLLFVWRDGKFWFHNSGVEGHLKANIEYEPRACFEVDTPGQVFAYGRYSCDTSIEYQSVVAFGSVRIEVDRSLKLAFFDSLMAKYYPDDPSRIKHFYPRLDTITLYALNVERITGKETMLPIAQDRWPAVDRTKSPDALPP